ncbi:hypothetical protein JZ751_024664 [Albula glossodonta]|uniref:Ig-like domain-containing protein n=1 Tax=Albula glossodonta TaxID=121402 RepID=A0A8T2PE13_9TELE|nr:hypothetical protein JZ751_024664 [Albula glossodonta]
MNIKSIDYRDMGYISPVEDQGLCGSCWAYSATGALEAQWMKKTGKLIPLSKQQLVDCSTLTGNKACVGGRPSLAYMYIMQNGGIQAETSYPYVMEERSCQANSSENVAWVKDWKYVPPGDEQAFEDALVTIGPIAVVIDTTTRNFQFYRKGIFYDPKCSIWKQAHAVVLMGFGTEGSEEYWTIKNSWGIYWGEEGYMRLAKNRQRNSTGIVSWYKQTPGQGPQFILSYSTNNTFQVSYGHGFNSSSSNATAPSILVFQPIQDKATLETVTLVCLVRGLLTDRVDISWRINDTLVPIGDSVAQASREPDGSFSATGLLSVSSATWSPSNSYRCTAHYGSTAYEGSTVSSCYSSRT